MRKTTLTTIGLFLTLLTFCQVADNQKLIDLGKSYKDYMFRNEPTREVLKEISSYQTDQLKTASEFIAQTISTKNKLLTQTFLSRPDDQILKEIYIIRAISLNLREENQIDNNKLIDSLRDKIIPVYELVDNYYGMLFAAVGNKNQPFNLSKMDFKMQDYNLQNDTERGILFLRCIDFCGKTIWGYMNVVKPANTAKAYDNIKKFPKFNGRPYFQNTDLFFTDFEMIIVKDNGIQSYKAYYLDKYYETLLYHLLCLKNEGGSEDEKNDLMLGSILKESSLYKYSKYKETLEGMFKEVKR